MELHAAELVSAAHRAGNVLEYERNVLARIGKAFRADAALIVREHGPGTGASGVRAEIARFCRTRWRLYGEELASVFEEARSAGGVAVDIETLGEGLFQTCVFREFIQPHGGRCTLIGMLTLGGDALGTIALGRTRGSFGARDRERLASLLPALAVCEAAMRRRSESWAILTSREQEIVRALRLGYTNAEIAASLGTSVNTVRNQLRSVFKKLGATTRAEAVALSLGHGT